MHALKTYHWALIGRSNRCKEGTALNIHCIPMHLAISGLDLVNVYGSAPELKQSSRTWQQKEAKFLVFGLWDTASQPNFFNGDVDLPGLFFKPRLLFLNGLKRGLTSWDPREIWRQYGCENSAYSWISDNYRCYMYVLFEDTSFCACAVTCIL